MGLLTSSIKIDAPPLFLEVKTYLVAAFVSLCLQLLLSTYKFELLSQHILHRHPVGVGKRYRNDVGTIAARKGVMLVSVLVYHCYPNVGRSNAMET